MRVAELVARLETELSKTFAR
jgi:hypothetical protein